MPTTTFTYTAEKGNRFAHAVGVALQLKDANGDPRDATKAEAEAWLWGRAKQLVVDIEGAVLTKAAVDAVVVPEMELS